MTIKKNPKNDLKQQFENLVQNDPKERLQNVQRNYSLMICKNCKQMFSLNNLQVLSKNDWNNNLQIADDDHHTVIVWSSYHYMTSILYCLSWT